MEMGSPDRADRRVDAESERALLNASLGFSRNLGDTGSA